MEIRRDAQGRIVNSVASPEQARAVMDAVNAASSLIGLLGEVDTMATRETPTHSPGPWYKDADGQLYSANGLRLAILHGDGDADDRLILKGAELLAACRTFCLRCERGEIRSTKTYATMRALVDHIDGE